MTGTWPCVRNWTSPAREPRSKKRGDNLREALELFFETASSEEIKQRLKEEVYVTQVEVAVG